MGASTASTLGLLLLIIPGAGSLANALLGPRLGRRFVNLVGPGASLMDESGYAMDQD